MAAGTRNVRIQISEECFALLADAMCAFSKRSGRFQSFRATTQHACECIRRRGINREELDQFRDRFIVDGAVVVWLEIKPDWIDVYEAARTQIANVSGKTLHDKEIIPFLAHQALQHHMF